MNQTPQRSTLPVDGTPMEEIQTHLEKIEVDKVHGHWWRAFRGSTDVQAVGRDTFGRFFSDNGLLSLSAGYMSDIRQQLVDMCVGLMHPDTNSTGSVTSGGSESIYSALHAVREWARDHRPEVREPTVVAPASAHPSFSKGCHYLGMRLVRARLGPDFRVDPESMRAAITEDTVCLVGSAPNWYQAFIDPIEDIAAMAVEHGAWMHVDGCVGGYMLPFLEKLGHAVPPWDFRVPGVQSISADLHKLGYCPKPCSTILWRDASFLDYHNILVTDVTGGSYKTEGFLGSRPAGSYFAAWAVMTYLGETGYLNMTRKMLDNVARLTTGINALEGLEVWPCDVPTPLSFSSNTVPIESIMGGMVKRYSWLLVGVDDPPRIVLPVDVATDDAIIEPFLSDLGEVVDGVLSGQIADSVPLRYG